LTRIEDTAVHEIVETQVKLGFHPIMDGEYRRHSMLFSCVNLLRLC
jgi:methionine synthase II (cobalamin-independent)